MKVVYVDVETWLFEPGMKAPPIVCLSHASTDAKIGKGLMLRYQIEDWLEPMLDRALNGELYIGGHGISYDMACLIAYSPRRLGPKIWKCYVEGRITCTEMRANLIDIADDKHRSADGEERNYNLEDLALRVLHKNLNKAGSWRKRYKELDGVPLEAWPHEARAYPMSDVEDGLAIWKIQQEDLDRRFDGRLPTEMLEVGADFAFELVSAWGIRTDEPRVRTLWSYTQKHLDELREKLIDVGLLRPKIPRAQLKMFAEASFDKEATADTKWLRTRIEQLWREELGELPMTDGGTKGVKQIKTGKDVLSLFPNEPGFSDLIQYNSLSKSGSTYVKKLFQGIEMPIHASYWALGAASARASSSGPNMQNQPRLPGVRECFVAREGRAFVASDFKTQEMVTLAQHCLDVVGYSTLARRFQEDPSFDAHLELAASQLLFIPVPEAIARYAANDPVVTEMRQGAKAGNFGLPGGMGVAGLIRYAHGYGVNLTVDQAVRLIEAWHATWPEMVEFFKWVRSITGDANYGTITIPRSGFRRGGCAYTDACNTCFQTPASHATKSGLFEACRRMYSVESSALFGARMVNCVHDELMAEGDEDGVHEIAMELEEVMAEEMRPWVPDLAHAVRAEAVAMKHWSKKAKRIVENGRLQIWDAPFPIKEAA